MKTNFQDVQEFHDKMGLDSSRPVDPVHLHPDLSRFRLGFMVEELAEYAEAIGATQISRELFSTALASRDADMDLDVRDLPKACDALIDLSVVTLGTADFHGMPWQECWEEVHAANMAKRRAERDGTDSKRRSGFDVVKPEGWKAPDIAKVLRIHGG